MAENKRIKYIPAKPPKREKRVSILNTNSAGLAEKSYRPSIGAYKINIS